MEKRTRHPDSSDKKVSKLKKYESVILGASMGLGPLLLVVLFNLIVRLVK